MEGNITAPHKVYYENGFGREKKTKSICPPGNIYPFFVSNF